MKIIVLFSFLFVLLQTSAAVKLNYPRVLLPIFEKLSINFTLEVIEGGCFKWTSSRPDLISISPIFDDLENSECTAKAVVTTLSREKHRNTAIVLAEDLSTSEVLRCDVILDVIDQLGVLTTTRELYLEEAPETFELWAQDSQGNAFTTLEGVEFNWKISSQTPNEGRESDSWQQVLRFLPFSESKYHEVPSTVEKFDRLGSRGYMVLLEAINTGSAKVTVQLPYAEYGHVVSPIEVNIMVLANIILDPSDAHILVGDSITIKILQLKQGKLEDITDNTQYYLESEDLALASVKGNIVTGNILGKTSIILKDRNLRNDNLKKMDESSPSAPSIRATLTISRADKMNVNLLPHYNWVTVEGERHTIAADLYTHDNQLITLGSKYKVNAAFDENIFYKISKTVNGSRILGETLKPGMSPVLGTFESLKAKADLQVYKKIDLKPLRVVLPYDPNHPKRQKIQYTATGGDGSFIWSSLNSNLISISQSGLAETKIASLHEVHYDRTGKHIEEFVQIKVALQRNNKISKTAEVLFLPPAKLEIVKYNFETALGDNVWVHVALYAEQNGEYIPFTSCDNLHFEYELSSDIFHIDPNEKLPNDEKLHPSACHLLALRASSLGGSNFRITYIFLDKVLRDEVNLVVFDRLDILSPIENEVVLPIGSSRNIIYHSGPQKVFNIDAEIVSNTKHQKNLVTVTSINNEYAADKRIFNVLCLEVGETKFVFEIYNTLSKKNYVPYISRIITNIHCVKPRFLNLYTTEKLRESCPLKLKNSLMHVKHDNDNLEVGIEVLDAQNRKLMNISSLTLTWKFSQSDNGHTENYVTYAQKHEDDIIANVAVPRRDYLLTTIPEIHNSYKIKATVTGYDTKILSAYSITPESPEFGIPKTGKDANEQMHKPVIENEINFMAVNSTLLPFDSISIFLALKHAERVQISQGSGFYSIKVNEEGIINVEYDEKLKEIVITPLKIGQLQIDLIDRCLMTEPSRLHVTVVSIGRIEARVYDRVEKTKTIEAVIRLYDSLDDILSIDYKNLDIYELHEHIFNPNILTVSLASQMNLNVGEIKYQITGMELGETKIVFNSGYGEKLIASSPVNVQVFSPLRLYPRNSTVIVGSCIQIYSHGGPYPDVNIVYSVQNENIISIDSSIVTALRLGQTTIVGRCVGVNPVNSQPIIFSEDIIEIHVVPLDRVKIRTPLIRIKAGAVMPATIWGVPNISPIILGTLSNLKVSWSTNQPDVVDILGIFSDSGIEYEDVNSISVRIKALNPGKAKIKAEVTTANGKQNCAVEIIVFKMLELELPKRITSDAIIVPPNSNINLRANLPDVIYQFSDQTVGGLKITKDGVLKTTEAVGRDLIIASVADQTLSIPIEIKNIHYVLATLHSPTIRLKHPETKIPSGMNIILKVTLHDNLGNELSHSFQDSSLLRYGLSRKEDIDINFGGNFTVAINLPRETTNMLSISLKDATDVKYYEDVIKLSVDKSNNNFPTKKIFSVGDIICFDSPLALTNEWTSSDENTIRIINNLGVGRVLSSNSKFGQQVTVINGNPSYGHIKYDLEIREADNIEFVKPVDLFNGEFYNGHVIIKNHLQLGKASNLFARNVSTCSALVEPFTEKFFTCQLKLINHQSEHIEKILDILKTIPTFDRSVGAYACQISLLASISELINLVKSDELQFALIATLENGISATANLRMIPAINASPQEISIDQLDHQVITVSGLEKVLQKVEVSSSDSNSLEVIPTTRTHGSFQYKLKALKNLPVDESMFISIWSPLTAQTIQIPISPSNMIRKCLNQPFQSMSSILINIVSNFGLIISALIVLSATIWAFIYCFSNKPSQNDAFSPFQKNNVKKASLIQQQPQHAIPRGPLYPTSPFLDRSGSSNGFNSSNVSPISPVYGDSTLISPNKRINRRYL